VRTSARRHSVSRNVATPFFTVGIGRGAWRARVVAIVALAALLSHVPSAVATTYYVSATGKDSNSGTTSTAPFLTIKKAADLTKPGDIVDVMNGTYGPFIISHAGSQRGGYITYQAYPGQHPTVLKNGTTWDGIQIWNSTGGPSYIIVDGFNILGNAQSITASQAQSAPDKNNTTNGNCIGAGSTVHHVIIRNNTVSYCPGAGMMLTGDYISIYNNIIHHNAFWSPYDTSGLTVQGANSDGSTAVKIFVYDNVLYDNQNYICNKYQTSPCQITDGNGIIVDSNKAVGYNGRIRIYNNITYNNGGPGIAINKSQHVDIFNNTTYKNNISATEPAPYMAHTAGGEITATGSSDVRVINNISYGTSSVPMIYAGLTSVSSLVWDYNLLFNGVGAAPRGAHDLVVNPLFVSSPPFNFHLQTGSPAKGTGTTMLVPTYDFDGNPRSTGSVTRGAYQ
jgi:hypothetical protein